MSTSEMPSRIAQSNIQLSSIHLSCIDLTQTGKWFSEGLGLIPAGGTRLMADHLPASDILQEPGAEAVRWRLLAANPRFRVELYQFATPLPRLLPADARASDLGYGRIAVHAADFDAVLDRLALLGSPPIGPVLGDPGERSACVRNPDGLFVEIMERDPLPHAPRAAGREGSTTIRAVTLSTPDLATSIASFSSILGEDPSDTQLHDDTHEVLWGLDGARCRRVTFHGGDMLIELAGYVDPPGRPKPTDHRISDQGAFALELTADSKAAHRAILERAAAAGAASSHMHVDLPGRGVAFIRDVQGFPLVLAWQDPANTVGFRPRPSYRLVPPERWTVRTVVSIAAPLSRVWHALNDHQRMGRWIQADEFHVTKEGWPDPAGYGTERLLITYGRNVSQQVTHIYPGHMGYRAISGTPFNYHNGTAVAWPEGDGTHLEWIIRFRTNPASIGREVYSQLQSGIQKMLNALRDMVEAE